MKLHQTSLPAPEELARHLGLCDLRIGRHYLRNGTGELSGCVSVCTLWHAEVVPSFQPRIALAVVTASGEPYKDCCAPDFMRAVMATPEASHMIALETDPMRQALNGVDLFCCDQTPPNLNGIAYTLTFETMHLHGTLQFGNPAHRCLRSVEDALLGLARQIATQAEQAQLRECVDTWDEFVRDKSK